MRAHRILLVNSKGGCGKTTVATNLCACFAHRGLRVAIKDYDPQHSALHWSKLRDGREGTPGIKGIDASPERVRGTTRVWRERLEADIDLLVIDTPAGVDRMQLMDYVREVDSILVPVMPSGLDIHAVARFIQELLLSGRVRQLNKRVGIVANRVRRNTLVYQSLERFLAQLDIPLVTMLRDTQHYVRGAEQGLGVHDLDRSRRLQPDLDSWQPLIAWVNAGISATQPRPAHAPFPRIPMRGDPALNS